VGGGDGGHDGQPEAGTLGAPPGDVGPGEALEYSLSVLGPNARASIADPEPGPPVGRRRPQIDDRPGLGVLGGIVSQVHHHLGQALAVGHHLGLGGVLEAPLSRRPNIVT
jgi:hypothetical protein